MDRAMIITSLSLLELNLKHTIVSILNKPQWQDKRQDPVIRAKWLSEIRAGFISKIFDESLQWNIEDDIPTLTHLSELMHKPHSAEKETEAQEWSLFVRYELAYYVGKYKGEVPEVPVDPSDFQVREDGSVRILSYINNLHPAQHALMYASIEEIFSRFVPVSKRSLSNVKQGQSCYSIFNEPEQDRTGELRPEFPEDKFSFEASNYSSTDSSTTVKLNGKTVQVIVKIAEIVLTPDAPRYEGGSWHIEGSHAEQIVATGIYYFACENSKDSRLSFRVLIETPQYEQGDRDGVTSMYDIADQDHLVQALGSVNTCEDRCLVFSNGLQHKVEPLELEDPTELGVRTILAFFLVDPEQEKIPSTSVIPPQQQQDWIDESDFPGLKKLQLVDTAEATVREMLASNAMSRQEAEQFCLQFMETRSNGELADSWDEQEAFFNLCEH